MSQTPGGRVYTNRITMNPPPDQPTGGGQLNLYAVPEDPNGILDGEEGDRAWQIQSENEWYCEGGTVWSLIGGGAVGGQRTQFVWLPGGADDPDTGTYAAWDDVHAAAAEVAALNYDVDIVASGDGPWVVDADEFDMNRIRLVGFSKYEAYGVIAVQIDTSEGTTFTNWTRGAENCLINHTGSAPLCTLSGSDTVQIALGDNSAYSTDDAEIWAVGGTSSFVIFMDNRVAFGNAEAGNIILSVAAGCSALIYGGTNCSVVADCINGLGQATIVQGSATTTVGAQPNVTNFSLTPADQSPTESSVILRPSAANPGAGVFLTFQQAYNAAILKGSLCTIYVDNPGGPGAALVIPSSTYNMANIRLAGFTDARFGAAPNDVPTHFMITSAATVFTNFVRGMSNMGLVHNGDTALCTLTLGATALWVSTGDNGYYTVDTGNTGSIWQTAGTGSVTFQVGLRTIWQNSGTGYEILNLGSAGSSVVLQVNAPRFSADSIRGVASATLSIVPLSTFVYETQANLTTPATITSTASSLTYTPAVTGDWSGADPTTVQQALDRIAAALGPIT